MHIVHVITRLLQGGAEENTIATCLHQARAGAEVTLIHGRDYHPDWATRVGGQVRLIHLPSLAQPFHPRDFKATAELRALYRRLRPDVVHTHQSKAGALGRLAAALARVPLVVHTIHIAPFVNVTGIRRRLYIAAERLCARFTHLLIAVSHGMRDAFVEARIGGPPSIEVVHSGMPVARFASATPPVDWRSRIGGWDKPERPRILLMLAAFEPRKRQRQLLQAVAPRLQSHPDVLLLLAGEGVERQACEAAARELNIQSQVRFLGHDPNPHELIALADVCLLTSEREGLPRSVVQYIAGGKPVVMSRLPGIEELVVDGVNGVVTDADHLDHLVEEAFALIHDHPALERISRGARDTDVSRWNEEAMGENIEAAYARARSLKSKRAEVARPPEPITAIEFFGLPGSGKTTVARAVMTQLRDKGYAVSFSGETMGDHLPIWRRSLRRLRLIARELASRPGLLLRSIARLGAGPAGPRDRIKSVWNYCSVLAMSIRHSRSRHEVLVLDQGLVQALWTGQMHRRQNPSDEVDPALVDADWFQRCLFVHVQATQRVARSRLQRRRQQTSRMQQSDRAGDRALWEKAVKIETDLAAQLEAELMQRSLDNRLVRIRADDRGKTAEIARTIVARLGPAN
jgi:glycosyltransferase involved in cell wall biosynthesis